MRSKLSTLTTESHNFKQRMEDAQGCLQIAQGRHEDQARRYREQLADYRRRYRNLSANYSQLEHELTHGKHELEQTIETICANDCLPGHREEAFNSGYTYIQVKYPGVFS